jgi:hypothetical protein
MSFLSCVGWEGGGGARVFFGEWRTKAGIENARARAPPPTKNSHRRQRQLGRLLFDLHGLVAVLDALDAARANRLAVVKARVERLDDLAGGVAPFAAVAAVDA